jgi:uncharacterized RDD family membrane protein YckC
VTLAADGPREVAPPAVDGDAAVGEARHPVYIGIVTRAIAFAADAAVIQFVAIVVAGTGALILSVIDPSGDSRTVLAVIGAVVYGLWLIGYFVLFWSATGQTPGNRLLEIRVCRARGGSPPTPGQALVRFAGLILAAIPLFMGFLPILLDDRRRGLHDMLAGTVVLSAPRSPAESRPTTI